MYQRLKAFIEAHDTITIFTHIYVDGDAVGSVQGMKALITANYPHKKVYAIHEDVAPFNDILGLSDVVSDEIIKKSAALIVDVANGSRVSDERYKLAKYSFKLDHHIFVETFTTDEIVNNERIATAEMIGEFIMRESLLINEHGATALALGIITDSGRFFYDLTSALTFEVMAFLLNAGANFKKINESLAKRNIDGLKQRGYFMSNYAISGRVIYIHIPYAKLTELNILPSDGSSYVNMYGNFDGYPLWVTFFSDANGVVFTELRSKTHNVQKVAKAFGGGGHLKASGCRLTNEAQIADVLRALNTAEELI